MLWIVFRFVLIGPVVGALGFILADQVLQVAALHRSTLASTGSAADLPHTVGVLWLYSLLLAYPLGVIPAAITGLAFAFVISRQASVPRKAVRSFLAACFGAAPAIGLGIMFSNGTVGVSLLPWLAAGSFGGAAAGIAVTPALFGQLKRFGSTQSAA